MNEGSGGGKPFTLSFLSNTIMIDEVEAVDQGKVSSSLTES